MSSLVITKGANGKLEGFGEKGRRAWRKFRALVTEMEVGETLGFTYRMPRSPKHHRYTFAKLAGLFERQEQFEDFDRLREWLTVGAGHCDLLPGPAGALVAIPRSINWESLDEQGFIEFHRALTDFLWTQAAQAALWPHSGDQQRYDNIANWHNDFRTT